MELTTKDRNLLNHYAREFDHRSDITAQILTGEYDIPDLQMGLPPRSYQAKTATLAANVKGLLVGDELGLGKSVTALTLLAHKGTLPALVVCPTHLPAQWKREAERFLPGIKVHVIKAGKIYDIGKPDIIIINYHKLTKWADIIAPYVRTVIFDECQDLRRHESNKYSAAQHISLSAEYRCGLSATPIYNYGGEFFNVLDILAPGKLGERAEFMREWCHGYYDERKARILEPRAFGTYLRDSGIMVRHTKKEVGRELPSLNKVIQEVESDPKHLKKIESAATELAAFIVQANANKSSGFDVMKASQEFSNTMRQATGIGKAPFVAEFVKMLHGSTKDKIILFGWHRIVYSMWAEKLKSLNPAWFTGSESPVKKQKEIQRFIEDDDCKVLIMSLRSGSGVDGLQAVCSRVVIGELDWSPGPIEQCIGRVHRDGQKEPVFAYYLTTVDGADPIMIDVLGVKKSQLEGVKNPHGDLIKKSQIDPNHVKKLAENYLKGKK